MYLSLEIVPNQVSTLLEIIAKHPKQETIAAEISFYIPHIQGKPYQLVLEAIDALQGAPLANGARLRVCPHFAVRNILPNEEPHQLLQALKTRQIEQLLLLGGDAAKAAHFEGVVSFLHRITPEDMPARRLGFAAFAGQHPHSESTKYADMAAKAAWADEHNFEHRFYSQIEFEPEPVEQFIEKLEIKGIAAPLCVGFVAPCKMSKLARIANAVGVGNALRFAMKTNVFKLLTTYDSTGFINALGSRVAGLHCYSFGNLEGGLEQLLSHRAA